MEISGDVLYEIHEALWKAVSRGFIGECRSTARVQQFFTAIYQQKRIRTICAYVLLKNRNFNNCMSAEIVEYKNFHSTIMF